MNEQMSGVFPLVLQAELFKWFEENNIHNIVKSRKSALKNESLIEKSDGSLSGVN